MIFLFPLVGYVSIPVGFSYRKTQVMRICRAKSGDHSSTLGSMGRRWKKTHAIFGGRSDTTEGRDLYGYFLDIQMIEDMK